MGDERHGLEEEEDTLTPGEDRVMDSASILLLMSDEVERLRVEQILRVAGHEVISVSTVSDASEQLVAEPLDLFICELDRRKDDRIALLTAAKWRLPYLARLLFIAESEHRMAQKALETGIVHFTLVPPASSTVLLDTVTALLRWTHEQRLGTPASQTGRNSAVRRQLRETLDEDHAWEQELAPQPEEKGEPDSPDSSDIRGRIQWYY